ncbi:MAG: hypothetical protein IKA80_06575 [Spirochaetaceae bacterium]|nr:hypothetical protein [Spirochaetaceae bacterium]
MAAQTESPRKKSPEGTSRSMAVLLTMLVWVVAFSVAVLLPPELLEKPSKPVYQRISLTLAPLSGISQLASAGQMDPAAGIPVPEDTEEVPGSSSVSEGSAAEEILSSPMSSVVPTTNPPVKKQASSSTQQAPNVSEPVAAAVPSRTTAPAASSPVASSPPPAASPSMPAAAPSPDQEPVDPSSFDQAAWEALFGENSTSYTFSPESGKPPAVPLDSTSSLSGVAATGSPSVSGGTTSSSALPKEAAQPVAAGTTESLSRIATAAAGDYYRAGSEGQNWEIGSGTSEEESSTGAHLELVGGGRRRLLEPGEPVILISRENQRLIPGSLEVTITFEITPEGVVQPGSIKITPESLVHQQVQEEIRAQIGKWRFQVAEGSGQVRFKYNIMKK